MQFIHDKEDNTLGVKLEGHGEARALGQLFRISPAGLKKVRLFVNYQAENAALLFGVGERTITVVGLAWPAERRNPVDTKRAAFEVLCGLVASFGIA